MPHEAHYKTRTVEAFTASAQLSPLHAGGLMTNRGALATVTLTLPPGEKGLTFSFLRVGAFALRIDPFGTEVIEDDTGVALAAGKYQSLDSDGARIEYLHDGTNWMHVASFGTNSDEP